MDKTVGNLLHAIPDAEEYQERLHTLSEAASQHLAEWMQATKAQQRAYLALKVDLEMLEGEVIRADGVVASWKKDIMEGADDLAIAFPALGFRVIKDLPRGVA